MDNLEISFFDFINAVSGVIDMVSPQLEGHHKRVAFMAANIARRMGFEGNSLHNLYLAALLHDCGALSLKDRLETLRFEAESAAGLDSHAELGSRLMGTFRHLEEAAEIVRYHHTPWIGGDGVRNPSGAPAESFVLQLADRADVLAGCLKGAGSSEINDALKKKYGSKLMPESIDAYISLSKDREFSGALAGLLPGPSADSLHNAVGGSFFRDFKLDIEGIMGITRFIERIIDFRSRFTATHSNGVAAVAEYVGGILGLSEFDCRKLKIAGYLHDLGKLAVPSEYLDKPGKLTWQEYSVVKKHAYYSYDIMKRIKGLEEINLTASLHHERLSGGGYPFGLKGDELSTASRIMAVSDIFTALTEDRPYRKGMDSINAAKILKNIVSNGSIDGNVVEALVSKIGSVDTVRAGAQSQAIREYEALLAPSYTPEN